MIPLAVCIVMVLLMTALAGIMSAAVAASALVSQGRVLRLVEAERPGARVLDRLMGKSYRFRTSAAFSSALSYSVAAVTVMWAIVTLSTTSSLVAAILGGLLGTVIVFAFGHALPRVVAVQNPEDVALAFAPMALPITRVLYGPAKVFSWPFTWVMRLTVGDEAASSPWITEDEYRFSTPDDEDSVREETEVALLEAVSDFAEKVVREVMIPRTDMTCLPDTATAAEAIALIEAAGYSRLPVYQDTLDNIRGVLYAKDLLAALAHDRDVLPAGIARRPYFVPETKPVQELLIEMRARTHIALVADEYGGTAGLITIEDLLEEIVGEIFDEYDREVPLITELGNGRYLVDARLPVDDMNERFGTAIESESDTVGGVVIEIAGCIPVEGDTIEVEGLRFIVEDLQGTRIKQLVLESVAQNNYKEGHDA